MKKSEQKIKINGVWEEAFPVSRSALIYRPDDTTVEQALSNIENNKLDSKPNGIDPLIHNGKLTSSYFPDVILGQMQYGGTFNIYNTISTSPYTNLIGKSLIGIDVSEISGFYFIYEGPDEFHTFDSKEFGVGDWLVCNGAVSPHWTRIKNTDAVTSVNGMTGAVTLPDSNFTWVAQTQLLAEVEHVSLLLRNQLYPRNKTPMVGDAVVGLAGTDSDGTTGVYLALGIIVSISDVGYRVYTVSSSYIRGSKGLTGDTGPVGDTGPKGDTGEVACVSNTIYAYNSIPATILAPISTLNRVPDRGEVVNALFTVKQDKYICIAGARYSKEYSQQTDSVVLTIKSAVKLNPDEPQKYRHVYEWSFMTYGGANVWGRFSFEWINTDSDTYVYTNINDLLNDMFGGGVEDEHLLSNRAVLATGFVYDGYDYAFMTSVASLYTYGGATLNYATRENEFRQYSLQNNVECTLDNEYISKVVY